MDLSRWEGLLSRECARQLVDEYVVDANEVIQGTYDIARGSVEAFKESVGSTSSGTAYAYFLDMRCDNDCFCGSCSL